MARKQTLIPWERLEGEPISSYNKFLLYRDLGHGRSLARAYALHLERKGASTATKNRQNVPGNWRRQCARFQWKKRAIRWQIYKYQAAMEEKAKAAREKIQIEQISRLAELVARMRKSQLPRLPPL